MAMTNDADDVTEALKLMPVSWLHLPRLALEMKDGQPQPKIAPLVAAALGVATGAGIQLAGQALRKAGPEKRDELVKGVECHLPIGELEQIARDLVEDAEGAKGEGLREIAADAGGGAKPIPVAAAVFLAGVAAGAAAARP